MEDLMLHAKVSELKQAIEAKRKGEQTDKSNRAAVETLCNRLIVGLKEVGIGSKFLQFPTGSFEEDFSPLQNQPFWRATMHLTIDSIAFQMPVNFVMKNGKYYPQGKNLYLNDEEFLTAIVETCIDLINRTQSPREFIISEPTLY